MLKVKRVYEPPARGDGKRILVDRLWPRGLKKEDAKLDEWLKDVAPSDELRKWYGHDPEKWPEFKRRYAAELKDKKELLSPILEADRKGTATLLFSSKEEHINNAVALKGYLEKSVRARK